MLAYTVENSGLRDAKIPGVTVAGKSGSADLYDTERGEYIDAGTLSFAGMFPAENPRVGHGSGVPGGRLAGGRVMG